mmetsp:Transcript_98069/g.261879  ORF Transcript_98069/g.261879 Transcript_98069/m.261879 type:complete len:289 (-) Transcript_98069:373-1239(-)
MGNFECSPSQPRAPLHVLEQFADILQVLGPRLRSATFFLCALGRRLHLGQSVLQCAHLGPHSGQVTLCLTDHCDALRDLIIQRWQLAFDLGFHSLLAAVILACRLRRLHKLLNGHKSLPPSVFQLLAFLLTAFRSESHRAVKSMFAHFFTRGGEVLGLTTLRLATGDLQCRHVTRLRDTSLQLSHGRHQPPGTQRRSTAARNAKQRQVGTSAARRTAKNRLKQREGLLRRLSDLLQLLQLFPVHLILRASLILCLLACLALLCGLLLQILNLCLEITDHGLLCSDGLH